MMHSVRALLVVVWACASTSAFAQAGSASPPTTSPSTPPKAGKAAPPSTAPTTTAPASEQVPASLYAKLAGVSLREQTAGERAKVGRTGYVVDTVSAGSPAAKAGVTKDDLITSIDGSSPANVRDLVELMQGAAEGKLFKVVLLREGRDLVLDMQMPGETEAEREKREEEEKRKREEEEKKEREDAERKESDEAESRAKEEAEKTSETGQEGSENVEQAVEDDDKFGMLGCCICSALCPPATPAFVVAMILVDAAPVRKERAPTLPDDTDRVAHVRY